MFSADNFYSQSGSRYVIDKVEHSNEIIIKIRNIPTGCGWVSCFYPEMRVSSEKLIITEPGRAQGTPCSVLTALSNRLSPNLPGL